MKNIIFIILIASSLISCSKSESTTNQPKPTVVGKWNYTKERIQVLSSAGAVISDQTSTSFTPDDFIQYNADGTGVASAAGGDILNFSYSISGNTDTEYQTPKTAGETPYVFTITLTNTVLTRHSQTVANSQTTIIDDTFIKK